MMNIRQLTLTDLPALQQISRQTFFDTFKDANTESNMQQYLDKTYATAQLMQELSDPNMAFYFAEIGDQPVGYLKLNFATAQTELQDESAVEIERIYVLHNYHGKGIGQQLYEFAVQTANRKNADYLWLGVWENNHNALRFYEKNGFVPFDKHIFKLGNDEQTDIMMKLKLEK
ncbi:spermine/spermidine N-acetyltransferase [Cricetibacter osteomyelitidis]|uniref:Spermine/spermidine N-acetyltransferase n=1 Tax=Cricetibacter osteomyelitidis TaxID=1521931 RepID=A0A4R2T059_9PAST|nr:GNAT family N-acetyltransferase [Cricetibacter osteomyelitidis]TCP96219.1 spermine/spermidine N-acetyltransferase [Cricetibacter osteomyelitidis]